MKIRTSASLQVRLLAVLNLLAGLGIYVWALNDLLTHGTAWTEQVQGGPVGAWLAMAGLLGIPAMMLIWLGVGLWRLERWAWALQLALAILTLPLYGIGLIYLVILARRPVRWSFGIGPDAVLAEIDAREAVKVSDLAAHFAVDPAVLRELLEHAIAAGVFLGAFDRAGDMVYSVDTVLTREDLQRCPHCGGATRAIGNLAECPYCGTGFAKLSGIDFPMPAPIGLSVITAMDSLFCYLWAFMAAIWSADMVTYDYSVIEPARAALAWFVCAVLPLALSAGFLFTGRRLEAGDREGWIMQMVLLPPAIPYLLRRRIRVLFTAGLEPLRSRLASEGAMPMDEVATVLGLDRRHGNELAIYLTSIRALDSVLDWHGRRLIRPDLLEKDGRTSCRQCGAPHRIGGWCAWCGTAASRARAVAVGTAPDRALEKSARAKKRSAQRLEPSLAGKSHPRGVGWLEARKSASSLRAWLASLALSACFAGIFVAAMWATRREVAQAVYEIQPVEAPRTVDAAARLEPVGAYDPARKETFMGVGINFLTFNPEGTQLLSGEGNGLFLWDVASRRRILRTPSGWQHAGVSWAALLSGGEFVMKPYYRAFLWGKTGAWALERKVDLDAVCRDLGDVSVADAVVTPDRRLLAALSGKGVIHLFDVTAGRRLHSLQFGADHSGRTLFDPTGQKVAAAPIGAPDLAIVWDVVSGSRLMTWTEEPSKDGRSGVYLSDLGFDAQGERLITLELSGIDLWDIAARRRVRHVGGVSVGGPLRFSGDGRRFAVTTSRPVGEGQWEYGVAVFDADGSGPVASLGWERKRITALAIDWGGRLVATGNDAGEVRFWPLEADAAARP